jgi:hypothetical protein
VIRSGRRPARRGALAVAALLVALASACTTASYGGRTGRPIGRDAAAKIAPGMTKAELFERLGAPLAIVGRGETAEVAAITVARPAPPRTSEFVVQGGGTWPLQGDAVLALFADRHALTADHRVYYYVHADDTGYVYIWLLFVDETYKTRSEELWVLVDEASERVVDVIFRTDR